MAEIVTLYHGSKGGLVGDIAPMSRSCCDFGRYNTEALYYAGWITRYWHYLTGESSREIHAQRNARELLLSYGYHSMANELAVENMKADASRGVAELKERKVK